MTLSEFTIYLRMGYHHIAAIGAWDHILFVAALTAAYGPREWKRIAILVTAFTIGHSITLALATFELVNFFGMYAPAATPDPVIRKLNATIVQALKSPEVATKLKERGFEPAPTTPEQFRDFLRAESAKFQKIIADANVKVDQ